MQVNRIQSNNCNNQPNFGMAVTASAKGKKMLEECLTPKGAKKLEKIIEAEKSNPTNVHITTQPSLITGKYCDPIPYDEFVVKVNDKTFKKRIFDDMFSASRGMISVIKRAVKHAHSITEKENVLKNIPEK